MRIAIIGTGYVGLVSGACFSDFGHDVICVDKDAAKIDALKLGAIPIFEPGLHQLVARNVAAGRLAFTTELAAAVSDAETVAILTYNYVGLSQDKDGKTEPSRAKSTRIYVKKDNKWMLVHANFASDPLPK